MISRFQPTFELYPPPSSVVKSRLQAGHAHALRYKSSIDGILTIMKEEGVEGLYKGMGSKLIQSVLTAAILFAGQRRIYKLTKKVCPFFFSEQLCPSEHAVHRQFMPLRIDIRNW